MGGTNNTGAYSDNVSHFFQSFHKSIRRAARFKDLQTVYQTVLLGSEPEGDDNDQASPDAGDQENQDASQSRKKLQDSCKGKQHDEEEAGETTPLVRDQEDDGKKRGRQHLASRLDDTSRGRVEQMNKQREETQGQQNQEERDGLTVKQIKRDDDTVVEVIVGQSTMSQTIFNSSNTLLGVGLLSLPLGLKYAGWVIGLGFLAITAVWTRYTAGILAKCLDVDSSLANFADIAFVAFGEKARVATSTLFSLELVAACVALVILFADSLDSLIPGYDTKLWKIICGIILVPLNFFPMKWLSYTSFAGIFCALSLIAVTSVDGLLKPNALGSLRDPAMTYAFPEQWAALPLSFGLIMAPWGGHSVFPNIYRDMDQPWKYEKALNFIFSFTTSMDAAMAIIGWLMFGSSTKDEISTNVLLNKGYPKWLDVFLLVLICIIPLTKFPLNCAPVISSLEVLTAIDPRAASTSTNPNFVARHRALRLIFSVIYRVGTVVLIVLLAIVVPSFEVISAVMGAGFCFLICVVLPCAFHLKMFRGQLSMGQKAWDWSLIVLSVVLGIVGTVWEFLPRDWIGI